MDLDSPLMKSYFSFGHFGDQRRSRTLMNWMIKLVVLVNATKLAVIALNVKVPNLKFYLIEMYLFSEENQKLVDVGMTIIQFGLYGSFSYWSALDKNVQVLRCFDFLFISDLRAVCRYYRKRYGLDRNSIECFLAKYRLFARLLRPTLVIYGVFLLGVVLRCLVSSYYIVDSTYFLRFTPFLFSLTATTYLILDFYSITKFFLVFLSSEFLLLRIEEIDRMITNRFKRRGHFAVLDRFKKNELKAFQVLFALDDFARQFRTINVVLDAGLSRLLLGVFIAELGLPYFLVFVENPLSVRLLIGLVATLTALLCYSPSFYNDKLKRRVGLGARRSAFNNLQPTRFLFPKKTCPQIRSLESSIHRVQPLFTGCRAKIAFSNFLSLNSPHQTGLSYTFLGIRYSTYSILDVRSLRTLSFALSFERVFRTNQSFSQIH